MKTIYYLLILLPFLLASCKTKEKIKTVDVDYRDMDTVFVAGKKKGKSPKKAKMASQLPVYQASFKRENDLLHAKLDVRFDWEKQHLFGKAWLTFKPLFYPTDSLILDAKGFDIHNITMLNGAKLDYKYDGEKLRIQLNNTFTAEDKYSVFIEYTAKPNERESGGSLAITSDKGLYFINPLGNDKEKPQQIWTQGETESNSCWFPTVDKPIERCTQEMYITVQDRFLTLSNGLKKSSTKNGNGTRTDYWVMDKPHAPYLFMMTIGEFAKVEDQWWDGTLLEYYVEPAYKEDAKRIFNHTPEMLSFFSDRLGVKYPWQKYSQVVVREYVSGAMENTTGVIFGDFVQKTTRELEDDNNDGIVAHEMMHHWFGDLVTCESWSNLPLNESFANYSEYLWYEYKYGKDYADHHRYNEIQGYMSQASNEIHPLIDFAYEAKEDMFDAHSYNKGGAILHMLRDYVGNEAFFASLKHYLEKNAYTAVEAHELRIAFEDVTGEDLNWFFNQWFYSSGHPELEIDYDYDTEKKEFTVMIEQMQKGENVPIFRLPLSIDIYHSNVPVRHDVVLDRSYQEFTFKVQSEPKLANVDAKKIILCKKKDYKYMREFAFQFYHGKNYMDRFEAIKFAKNQEEDEDLAKEILTDALNDKFWSLRKDAIEALKPTSKDKGIIEKIMELASSDKKSQVRVVALEKLADLGRKGIGNKKNYVEVASQMVNTDRSYMVISAALELLGALDQDKAVIAADNMKSSKNLGVISSVCNIYSKTGEKKYLSYFENNWEKASGYNKFSMIDSYVKLLQYTDDLTIDDGLTKLKTLAMNMDYSPWGRYGAANGIKSIQNIFKEKAEMAPSTLRADDYMKRVDAIQNVIIQIRDNEPNQALKNIYTNWL